jgi:5-methylcytosine-specific restriction endonuclease McrA
MSVMADALHTYQHALVLDKGYQPMKVVSWREAIELILDEKAELVVGYANSFIHSVSATFEHPAVIRLLSDLARQKRIRFSRRHVLARDQFECQYCGVKASKGKKVRLTMDHVVPRAASKNALVRLPWNGKTVGITSWENVVASCNSCNARKADRTPAQAGMKLRAIPRTPTAFDVLRMSVTRQAIPPEWSDWLPDGWGEYWDVELSAE